MLHATPHRDLVIKQNGTVQNDDENTFAHL
jgi:hypothetical protein